MKIKLFIYLTLLSTIAFGQDKGSSISYNKLIDLKGTNFIVATVENYKKMFSVESYNLLFINVISGDTNQFVFQKGTYISEVEQIKIDSLQINKVVFTANTIDLDKNNSIDWKDPRQVFVCSVDGTEKKQITEDKFFTRTWIVNSKTGNLIITGKYDSNGNGKDDTSDKSEILVYDLKTMSLIKKI